MNKAIFPLIALLCATNAFGQGDFFIPFPLFGEGASTVYLNGSHASPSNDSTITGIAVLRLEDNWLSYHIQTTGPWLTSEDWASQRPRIRVGTIATGFELPLEFIGFTERTSYDLIAYLPGQPVPPPQVVDCNFFGGGLALSDSQRSELISGESLLTIDFGLYGSIGGQVVIVPEPSVCVLVLSGAATIGGCRAMRRKGLR